MTACDAWLCDKRQSFAAGLISMLAFYAVPAVHAAEPTSVKIAVFAFELDDRSAGGGIVEQDATDVESLKGATEEARRLLAGSGRYSLVDVAGAVDELQSSDGIRHCNGCEASLAGKLGADRSLAGIITRITRTEYTLQIVVRDARSGAVLSNDFTGLRMGANYSWPRGVKWLMNKGILSASSAR
jgi:hypothetical protein